MVVVVVVMCGGGGGGGGDGDDGLHTGLSQGWPLPRHQAARCVFSQTACCVLLPRCRPPRRRWTRMTSGASRWAAAQVRGSAGISARNVPILPL